MTNKRLVWYLEKQKQIDDRQFVFISTIDEISKLTKILDGFRRKEKIAAIFFNIKKAYNKINRIKTFEHKNIETNEEIHQKTDKLYIDYSIGGITSQNRSGNSIGGGTKCDTLSDGN